METILIIDDSESQRHRLKTALEAAYESSPILEAKDGLKGLNLLLTHPVDVVVCDLEMPGLDGEKLLHATASAKGDRNVPFIFVTGSDDIERRVRLLERGAQDVIRKPFHPGELIARLNLQLKLRRLENDLSARNRLLEELSTTDELTQLRNRRYVGEMLSHEINRARRHQIALSILMVDLDHFKSINDEYGHAAGDAVLTEAGRRIRTPLRDSDIAARYGGEEFLIVLGFSGAQGALIAAERWRSEIADRPFTLPDGRQIRVTASIGAATFSPRFATDASFVAAADTALYLAKEEGRNCVRACDA